MPLARQQLRQYFLRDSERAKAAAENHFARSMQIPLQPKEEKKELSFLEHLGNTAAGAASGFAQGGPIGAVVGGGSALYKSMKTQEFDPLGSAVGPASLVTAGKEAGVLTNDGVSLEGADPLKVAALGKGFMEGDGIGALGTIGTIQQAEKKRAMEAKKLALEGITSDTLYDKDMNPRVVTRSRLGEVLTIDGRKATKEDDAIIKDLRPLEALKETRAAREKAEASVLAKEKADQDKKDSDFKKDTDLKKQAQEQADRDQKAISTKLSDGSTFTARPSIKSSTDLKRAQVDIKKVEAEVNKLLKQAKEDPNDTYGMSANTIANLALNRMRSGDPKFSNLNLTDAIVKTMAEVREANPNLLHRNVREKASHSLSPVFFNNANTQPVFRSNSPKSKGSVLFDELGIFQ